MRAWEDSLEPQGPTFALSSLAGCTLSSSWSTASGLFAHITLCSSPAAKGTAHPKVCWFHHILWQSTAWTIKHIDCFAYMKIKDWKQKVTNKTMLVLFFFFYCMPSQLFWHISLGMQFLGLAVGGLAIQVSHVYSVLWVLNNFSLFSCLDILHSASPWFTANGALKAGREGRLKGQKEICCLCCFQFFTLCSLGTPVLLDVFVF